MEPLTLTINYIRAQRYADTTWDMILGEPSEDFAGFVEQQAPELAQLQTLKTWKFRPPANRWILCICGGHRGHLEAASRWSAPGVATASSWPAASKAPACDEESCIQQLKPYFACEDENASLLPKSDWLADLDGVNIGTAR